MDGQSSSSFVFGNDNGHRMANGTMGEASVGQSAQAPLPSRRRNLGGPLHPSHRPHPSTLPSSSSSSSAAGPSSFVPALSSPLRMSDAKEHAEPSVFLSPTALSRKRSLFTADGRGISSGVGGNGLTSFGGYRGRTSTPARGAYSHTSTFADRFSDVSEEKRNAAMYDAPDLDGDASWYLGHNHNRPSFDASPSSRYATGGTWSHRQTSHYSQPQTSHPARPPQGEFSFQAQAPSAPLHRNETQLSEGTSNAGDGGGVESSSMAFARLAQAQRQQQEARRLAASGANDAVNDDDHRDGPPSKKRKGVAGTLMDGALNAALYTGAAALTAYSLWSSWGRKGEEEEEAVHPSLDRSAPEKLPPGALEEPPPPYMERQGAGTSKATMTPSTSSTPNSRPVHVFVSSRRRRPVFATHRSLRSTPRRRAPLYDLANPAEASPSVVVSTSAQPSNFESSLGPTAGHQQGGYNGDNDEDGDEDDDEMFQRFQSKMSSLIEEGTRALHAKADIGAMDLEDDDDDEFLTSRPSALTPSISEPFRFGGESNNDFEQNAPSFLRQSSSSAVLPHSQTMNFSLGGASHPNTLPPSTPRTTEPSAFPASLHRASTADSPRGHFLTLASRDLKSPYGRLSRPAAGHGSAQRRQHQH